jgi:hypothetical protein
MESPLNGEDLVAPPVVPVASLAREVPVYTGDEDPTDSAGRRQWPRWNTEIPLRKATEPRRTPFNDTEQRESNQATEWQQPRLAPPSAFLTPRPDYQTAFTRLELILFLNISQ